MLFLLNDGTYRFLNPLAEDSKIVRKYKKLEPRIKAVLVEYMTNLHSDTFVLVTKDHFVTKVKPFSLSYSISLFDPDTPISADNTMSRSMRVSSIPEYFAITSMLYQLQYAENVSDYVSIGQRRICINQCSILYDDAENSIDWDPEKEKLTEFLNRQGMYCDTDDFLDISMSPQDKVENGFYRMTKSRNDPCSRIQFYYHELKSYLRICDGKWTLEVRVAHPEIECPLSYSFDAYGYCITKTGLIYLATYSIAWELYNLASLDLNFTYTVKYTPERIWYSDADILKRDYAGFSIEDALYMALYLPQIWDMARCLYDESPLDLYISILQGKHYLKDMVYHTPQTAADRGIEMDLFAIIAATLTSRADDITIDD